ncbi:hypothetical protein NEOC65_002292, partial [Neochlamydia sp. AcF65]|nr:hypothetical protein [Neochlamydia sp. AcF65]
FIFGIKSNRLIAFSEEERKKGQYQNLNTFNFQDLILTREDINCNR